jgi:hypothetical protein
LIAEFETLDDCISCPLSASLALTGEYANPTPPDANEPGLQSQNAMEVQKGNPAMHWLWIGLVVLIVLGLIWYFSKNKPAA